LLDPLNPEMTSLINLHLNHVTYLLETNSYVRCLIIDFSKAVDTIDHSILLSKFSNLGLPANILNCIIDFLTDHQQLCKLGSVLSHPLSVVNNLKLSFRILGSGLLSILV